MEAVSQAYVHGRCLDVSVYIHVFHRCISTVYDGTLLIEQSVARVCNPVYSNLNAALWVMDDIGNTDPVCINQLPSRAPRLPARTWGRGARGPQPRPAWPTGRSGAGPEEHRIVWWRPPKGMSRVTVLFLLVSRTMLGHRFWRERRGVVYVLSLPQRELLHCCPRRCKRPYLME